MFLLLQNSQFTHADPLDGHDGEDGDDRDDGGLTTIISSASSS